MNPTHSPIPILANSIAPPGSPTCNPGQTWPVSVTFNELRVRLPTVRLHPGGQKQDARGPQYCCTYLSGLFDTEDQLARFIDCQNHRIALYCFPDASPDRIGPLGDFVQLMLAIDDVLDAATTQERGTSHFRADMENLVKGLSLREGGAVAHIAQAMLRLVEQLLTTGMSPQQADRFVAAVTSHAQGCLQETNSKLADAVNDLESYRNVHFAAGGQLMGLCMLEYACGVDIGAELQSSPLLRSVSDLAFWHVLLANSLFSFRKEMFTEEAATNLVAVLIQHQRMSLQDAVDVVCEEIRATEMAYYRARDTAFEEAFAHQAAVRSYLIGLDAFLSGNVTVHAVHPRYHGMTGHWLSREPRAGTMHIYPDHTEFSDPASQTSPHSA